MKITKEYKKFAKEKLDGFKEILRQSVAFNCACCGQQKMKGEAAGAHIFKTEDPKIWAMMQTPQGPRCGVYALCLECMDQYPETVIHQKVLAYLGTQGLFDQPGQKRPDAPGDMNIKL